ncbi:MAG: hypothetical protein ABEJ81_05100 [Haloferacaceae archaeon]
MSGALVTGVWLLDRGTALVTLPALWVAVLTGVFYRTRRPALFHRFSDRYHLRISMFAVLVAAMHAVVGSLDALLLGLGLAPAPNYPGWLFLAGVAVGLLSLVALAVAVLSFLAPWRFSNPSLVHALAYLGFAFGVVHAVAIGTDVVGLTERLVVVSLLVVAGLLIVKASVGLGATIRRVASG